MEQFVVPLDKVKKKNVRFAMEMNGKHGPVILN